MNTFSPIQSFRHLSGQSFGELERLLQDMSLSDASLHVESSYNYPVMLYQKQSVVLYRGTPEVIQRHAVQHARMRQYRDSMPQALIALMEKSLRLIERSNRRHREDVPAAVILQASSDHSGGFCSGVWISQLEQLANTYYIALQILGGRENFATAIQEAKQEVGSRNIMTLIVQAHGNRTYLTFDHANRYTTADVTASDFACLDLRASIILSACKTGLELAPRIAAMQPRPVFAAIDDVYESYFIPGCDAHGCEMLAFDSHWRQIIKKFQRYQNSVAVCETDPCCASDETINRVKGAMVHQMQQFAERGDAYTQFTLGEMYQNGRGVAQSNHKAFWWLHKAARQGNAFAQCNLGEMYRFGRGVTQSNHKAFWWLHKAARQGNAFAQCSLGEMYRDGQGVTQSYDTARTLFEQSANQGNAIAQCHLGEMYRYGLGVIQSNHQAFCWLRKAARQGNAFAQCHLGEMYRDGQGVTQSYITARTLFEQAASQGHAFAQYYLGEMYRQGNGVAQSNVQAIHWFRLAAAQGNNEATRALHEIEIAA